MDKKLKTLFWKEWCEQRWKAAFGVLLASAFTLIALRARVIQDFYIMGDVSLFTVALLPILTAMGVTASERAEGSLSFLLALPLKPRRILTVKLLIGAVVIALPVVSVCAVNLIVAGGREVSASTIIHFYALTLWLGVTLYLWTLAFGVTQRNEGRVGLIGLGVFLLWVFWFIAGVVTCNDWSPDDWYVLPFVLSPIGAWVTAERSFDLGIYAAWTVQIVEFIGIVFLVFYRFGRMVREYRP